MSSIRTHADGYYLFGIDLNEVAMAENGYGVINGWGGQLSVSAPGGGTTVNYLSGSVNTSKSYYTISSGSIALVSHQDATYPKKTIIYVDADDGTVKATSGAASAPNPGNLTGRYTKLPVPPDFSTSGIQAGDVVLAEVWLKQSGNNIETTDVTDRRYLVDYTLDSSGYATFSTGSTASTVSVAVPYTATDILIVPKDNLGGRTIFVTGISSSSFILNMSSLDTIPHTVSWVADSR